MATNCRQIFEYSMSLIDERLESGLVDATSTAIFEKNTPYILTTLQDEIISGSDYYKTETITRTAVTDNESGYAKYTMPSDFQSIFQIITEEVDSKYQLATDFKWEGNNILYIPDNFIGVYRVVYSPIPAPLTAMTDTLVLDDITCRTILVNGLASRLLTNENTNLANYFGDIYNELKNKPKRKQPTSINKIKDVYDSKLSY
jgi:hypothetical protein